jgi:hypothetical protein
MNYLEKVYVDRISPYLSNFREMGNNVWNCKCPYCNDSKKTSRKTRGYFHIGTEDDNLIYSCRNCSISVPLGKFIQDNFPQYYAQFKLDFFSKKDAKLGIKKPANTTTLKLVQLKSKINNTTSETLKPVLTLDDSHPAKQYLVGRALPDLSDIGYVENFRRYVAEMTNNDSRYEKLPEDQRIIIPLKTPDGEIMGFQGRALTDTSLRYITIKIPEMEDYYVKIYGLDKFNKNNAGFGVEGPFDSKFLPNCFAMCGTSLDMNALKRELILPQNTIIIIDNEPRNKDIVNRMYSYVEKGFRIYIPPQHLDTKLKDINKMWLDGWTKKDLVKLFVENSFTGIRAKLQIDKWKRVS